MTRWCIALALLAEEPQVILGVLEELRHQDVDHQGLSRGVRAVFEKSGREWRPFPSSCADEECLKTITSQYPPTVTWAIAFSGQNLGHVTAATPKTFEFYSDIGIQTITSKGRIPTVGERSPAFGGWFRDPLLRPLIADSQPYYQDPDGWKPSHPSDRAAASLRAQFRKKFPTVTNCATPNDAEEKPWPYRDADLKIQKAYSSVHGWSVVVLVLDRYNCDFQGPGESFEDQWFAVSPQGDVRFIGHGMWLVDAGDYDNDGKSEVVFAIDRYNEGGYELFYDDFKGHAVFRFSYH
jgi:hypothetical protein